MSIFPFYHNYVLFHSRIKMMPEEEGVEELAEEEGAEGEGAKGEGAVDNMASKIIILITIKRKLSIIMLRPH